MIYRVQTLEIAAYEGCRVALIPGVTQGQIHEAINQILRDRRVADAQITISPANYFTAPAQTLVDITVQAPADKNAIIAPLFFARRTLTGSCSMMKEF